MPQYLSPGVYVEELDAGPKPIEGVSTSVCGAVGVTLRGPSEGPPVQILSFADFTRTFGEFFDPAQVSAQITSAGMDAWSTTKGGAWWQFPLAVKAFFDNGGQTLYVKRVFVQSRPNQPGASAATAAIGHGLVIPITRDTDANVTTLPLKHLIGVGVVKPQPVKIMNGDGSGQIGGAFNITAFSEATMTVTLDAAVPQSLNARRGDFIEIDAIKVGGADTTVTLSAKDVGIAGNDISVQIEPMYGSSYRMLADPAQPAPWSTTLKVDAAAGAASITLTDHAKAKKGDHVVINGTEYELAADPDAGGTVGLVNATITAKAGTVVRALGHANGAGARTTLMLWGGSTLYADATVELSNGISKEVLVVTKVDGNQVTLSKNVANTYFEGSLLRVVEARVNARYVSSAGDMVDETQANVRLTQGSKPDFLPSRLDQQSKLIAGDVPVPGPIADLANFPATPRGGWVQLQNGSDALANLAVDDFVGMDLGMGQRTGIAALEDIDDISICIVPGMWSPVVHQGLIDFCELTRRFAILDPPDWQTIQQIQNFRQGLNSEYAALYYPWVIGRDPSQALDVRLPPSGHMAGVFARVDNDRGVHKAPANVPIFAITSLAQNVTKREQDQLNPEPHNINVLRYFPNRGNLVWGARCITDDTSWKYINVRRLFLYVEKSIDQGTQWVVFEPNDEPLWARVRQSITNFLTTTWRDGALQGSKPAEAFFVKCDRTTMTQDDIDNGRLICLIGIAPTKPAEFVIFRIQQKTLDQNTP